MIIKRIIRPHGQINGNGSLRTWILANPRRAMDHQGVCYHSHYYHPCSDQTERQPSISSQHIWKVR